MDLVQLSTVINKLPKEQRDAILELIELKIDYTLEINNEYFENHLDTMKVKQEQLEDLMKSKYNVLLGMISFLGLVLTVITILIGS